MEMLQQPSLNLPYVLILLVIAHTVGKRHPRHLGAIIYLYSLSLCVGIVVYFFLFDAVFAQENPSSTFGQLTTYWWHASLEPASEFYLLALLVWVTLVPQLISYALAGLFGCAARPIFLSQLVTFVSWTMIKAYAVAAGLQLAGAIFFSFHRGTPYMLSSQGPFIASLVSLVTSFVVLRLYLEGGEAMQALLKRCTHLGKFHQFMTRSLPRP
jgi:hypothetical protein